MRTPSHRPKTPPFNSLTLRKVGEKVCFTAAASLLPLRRCAGERERNFIEKMEGTGKTRVPGGVLQGFRLHQRLPFSAGRWTHNGKMSVAAVTWTSHWLDFERGESGGSGWTGGRRGRRVMGWGGVCRLRGFNYKLYHWRGYQAALFTTLKKQNNSNSDENLQSPLQHIYT